MQLNLYELFVSGSFGTTKEYTVVKNASQLLHGQSDWAGTLLFYKMN